MFVVLVILVQVSQHVSAVDMYEGDQFVVLHCQFPTFDVNNRTVVWSRYDLSPSTVHQRQQEGDELKDQNQLYSCRTSMMPDALETGDLSLSLTELKVSDSGTYTCSVRGFRGERRVTDVQLQVKERVPSWTTVLLILLTVAVIVAVGLSVCYRHYFMSVYQVEVDKKVHAYYIGSDKSKEQFSLYTGHTELKKHLLKTGDLSLDLKYPRDRKSDTYTCNIYSREGKILMDEKVELLVRDCQVEVEEGEESVRLPFKTTTHLPHDAEVWWIREVPEPKMKVHVYVDDSDITKVQNQIYRGRTEVKSSLIKTGDLSLTLKYPTVGDKGKYSCYVYNRDETILMKKTIVLNVKVQQVMSGVESVQLPCRTTGHLPDDATVAWRNRNNLMVHVYQNGSDRPKKQDWSYKGRTEMKKNLLKTGDLSLTLRYPTIGGTYNCTVYSWGGKILMNQKVELLVRDCQVEVEEGEESVQLPFKTTTPLPHDAQVWWRREVPEPKMKVHVFVNNSNIPEEQNQIYRGRTKMKSSLIKTGDVSLTLKYPTVGDRGKYSCYVYNRDGTIFMKKTMVLKVKERFQERKGHLDKLP